MALISDLNLKLATDYMAGAWQDLLVAAGTKSGSPAAGTSRYRMNALLAIPVGSADYEQQTDLATQLNNVLSSANVEALAAFMDRAVTALNSHAQKRGPAVDPSITSLVKLLTFRNVTTAPFTCLLHHLFGDLYFTTRGTRLAASNLFHPGISPDLDATAYPSGMGVRAVGGSLTDGAACNTTLYSEVDPLAIVTVDFAGGTGAPTLTIAGTDNTGATSTTFTATLDSNNPVSAVSTTITPSVTAGSRQTVALASASGIVPGSVLTVSSGLADQEKVIVTAVSGSNVTAYFAKAHSAGAAVTGKRTYTLTPSVAGRRLRDLTGITIGITGHSAGTVRIDGRQDRSVA
jgi:hypothetical protein